MKQWGLVEIKQGVRSLYGEWLGDNGYPAGKRARRYLGPSDAIRPAMKAIIRELGENPR